MDNLFYEIVRLDSRSGLIMGDSLADARGPSGPKLAIRCLVGLFGAQGGIRTRNALENFSSVARVTAVHTLGRLPRAADRAILPLRTPYSRNRARARHTCPGQSYPGKAGKLKPSQGTEG